MPGHGAVSLAILACRILRVDGVCGAIRLEKHATKLQTSKKWMLCSFKNQNPGKIPPTAFGLDERMNTMRLFVLSHI
jgi:hypothetical protein